MAGIISGKEIETPKEVKDILEFDEKVLLAFQQAGLGGKFTGLEAIFVTDRRVIKVKPKTLGLRADVDDYLYKDMANVKLNKGIVRSGIGIKMRFGSDNVAIENIPKEGANKIYKMIQEGIAGRLEGGKATHLPDAGVSSSQIDITEQIKKLGELKDAGVLTEGEFVAKKQELLAKI
jgi:hypothetical protein